MRISGVLLAMGLMAAMACAKPSIDWSEPASVVSDSGARLTISTDGRVEFSRRGKPPMNPHDSAACDSSVVYTSEGDAWFAAWNHLRTDKSVAVVAARLYGPTHSWSATAIVDSVDVAKLGCARPAPSIAVS